MDENDAVEALSDLGLSKYEAKVFVALQKLGTGTARDVHGITDVPRSQVYGAAESLQERGLVEVQQSKPIQYRPVSLEAAKTHLRERFERTQDRAFDYLEAAREEANEDEEREDVWTVHGSESVGNRVEQLIAEAESQVIFGVHESSLLTSEIEEALKERARAGVSMLVVADDPAVETYFEDVPVVSLPDGPEDPQAGRVLVVDDETVLISVVGDDETAIWSSRTGFAAVLGRFVHARIDAAGNVHDV